MAGKRCAWRCGVWGGMTRWITASVLTCLAIAAWGQQSTTPKFKAIWEPVSYPEDLTLTDVFFATADVGWVSGAGGTILHTGNGGEKWTPQLGGDPESRDAAITNLRFVNETHGWALQRAAIGEYRVLHTPDGESWGQIGSVKAQWGIVGFEFTSENSGVFINGNNNVAEISHTADAGRTWKQVFPSKNCQAKLQVEGLTRELTCKIRDLHFPTAQVGYAVGEFGSGAPDTLAMLKTEDGGQTWQLWPVPQAGRVFGHPNTQEIYFTTETTGFLLLNGKDFLVTNDGGRNWRGAVGPKGTEMQFADAEVGWVLAPRHGKGAQMSYTTDGGKRWLSRDIAFPAQVRAFSLPRRDRAYVVGDHGMIYRYRVVPVETKIPGELPAPAMPAAAASGQ